MNSTRYNTILLLAFILVLVVILVRGYYYTYVQPNYSVLTYVSCDPELEACFEYDGEYYAYATMEAREYAICSEEETCDEVCAASATCEVEYCTEEMLGEGETCSVIGEAGAEEPEAEEEWVPEETVGAEEEDLDTQPE